MPLAAGVDTVDPAAAGVEDGEQVGRAGPLARSTNARVVLVDVAVPFVAYMMTGGSSDGFYFDPAWDDEALESAKRYVAAMADRLRHAGVQAEGMAITGELSQPATSVAEAIMRSADEVGADLIVMSTHALTGPARALLGSVADGIVRNAHRPVLLPRRGEASVVRIPMLDVEAAEAVAQAAPSSGATATVETAAPER